MHHAPWAAAIGTPTLRRSSESALAQLVEALPASVPSHAIRGFANSTFKRASPGAAWAAAAWCPASPALKTMLSSFPPSVCVDVGVLDGADSEKYASAGHLVHGVEPTPGEKQARIMARVHAAAARGDCARCSEYQLHHLALSNETGSTRLFHGMAGGGQDSLVKTPTSWAQGASDVVRVDTFDRLLRSTIATAGAVGAAAGTRVLYTKIDTQGHDGAVLLGMKHALRNKRVRAISFEFWPEPGGGPIELYEEALSLLNRYGYTCFVCDERYHAVASDAQSLGARLAARSKHYKNATVASSTDIACMLTGAGVGEWHGAGA